MKKRGGQHLYLLQQRTINEISKPKMRFVMTVKDVMWQTRLIGSPAQGRFFIFSRQVFINGRQCNNVNERVKIGDSVKIANYEIVITNNKQSKRNYAISPAV